MIKYFFFLVVFFKIQAQTNYNSFVKSDVPIAIKYFPELNVSLDSLSKNNINNKKVESLIEQNDYDNIINLIAQKDFDATSDLKIQKTLGALYLQLNKIELAYKSFSKATLLSVNKTELSNYYYILSVIDIQKNNPILAYKNLLKAIKHDDSNINVILITADLANKLDKIDESIYYYEKALSINNKLNNVKNQLGYIYQTQKQDIKAIKLFSEIIDSEQNSAYAYSNRSISFLNTGKTEKALFDINKAIKILPLNSYAFKNRALIYSTIDDKDNACKDFSKAIELGYVASYGTDIISLKQKNCN